MVKKILTIFAITIILGGLCCASYAENNNQDAETARNSFIVENCDNIQTKLKSLQKSDSFARDYLGKAYETVLKDYVTPFNIRSLKTGFSETELIKYQNDFTETRTAFNISFVLYSQSLESLISINCKERPSEFNMTLQDVREKREKVDENARHLDKIIEQYRLKVQTIKENRYE